MTKLNIFTDDKITIDLRTLVDTRLVLSANSGGGKSYALRRLMESAFGKVQQVVLDMEGEFATLREKYDFLLVGNVKDGADLQISIKTADILAHKILELGISVIIDLYELKKHERVLFIKRFLESLVNAPKKLWHPVLLYLDEVHNFCPQAGKCESSSAVIDVCTRGRKRGIAPILSTQRVSKLNKDAIAECNNVMTGRTGLDIDRKRASEELGFTSKEQNLSLRNLKAGEFYVFGTAISPKISLVKVSKVKTSHPSSASGDRIITKVTPPTDRIKKMLKRLIDLPKEAERELKTKEDMKKEIHRQRVEMRKLEFELKKKGNSKDVDPDVIKKVGEANFSKGYNQGIKEGNVKINEAVKEGNVRIGQVVKDGNLKIKDVTAKFKIFDIAFTRIAKIVSEFKDVKFSGFEVKPVEVKPVVGKTVEIPKHQSSFRIPLSSQKKVMESKEEEVSVSETLDVVGRNDKIIAGAMRMLRACAMFFPKEITKARMGAIAGISFKSGSFGTYLATLKRNGLIEPIDNNNFRVTDEGMKEAGDVDPLPSDPQALISMWVKIVGESSGAGRMLKILGEIYPESLTKEELGERAGISSISGSFGTYLATLKRNGLIKVVGQNVQASEELFE